jgi:hypothetical protein
MKTTLNKIRMHSPCESGWKKLLKNLGKTQADDEPLAITTILESNGLDDALWCLRAVDGYQREMRLFAVECARSVQYLIKNQRSVDAIDVAERYANGLAADNELAAAWDAARYAAKSAARGVATNAATDAATASAWTAAWDAARSSAMAARFAAKVITAKVITAWYAARETQANYLCLICAEIEHREAA